MGDTIHATVRWLEWMPFDPDLGERLAFRIASSDGDGSAAELKRARTAINGLPAGLRSYDGFRQEYRILLDALPDLRMLARRWPGLAQAISELEVRDPELEHQHRQLRWRKAQYERWEQEERVRQARARQACREEREQRERERSERRDFAQRASWQMRGLSPEIATAFAELGLLPSAPLGLVETAYKWWILRAHPDLGNQSDEVEHIRRTERTKTLNRSREIIVEYFARRVAQEQR